MAIYILVLFTTSAKELSCLQVKGEVLSEREEALIPLIAISKILLKIKHKVLKDKARYILSLFMTKV